MASPDHPELARTQALCWLLDELLDAEEDLLALVARPGALSGWGCSASGWGRLG